MTETFEFAIIGSGVSGGRMAQRIISAGATCILLEAGPGFDRHTFPSNEMAYSTQMFWGGGMEVTRDARLGLLRARCLGGTSVVNQALVDPFDEKVWSEWRSISAWQEIQAEKIESYYDKILGTLATQEIAAEFRNRNAQIFCRAFENKGLAWQPLLRAQKDCALSQNGKGSDCIQCLGGCPRGSKQSTLETSIPAAIQNGLALETDFEVIKIEELKDRLRIYGIQHEKEVLIDAQKVVLAAGALGNATLLYRSGMAKSLPALGKGFTCHPQFMTFALFNEEVNAHQGAFQSVKSKDARLREAGYKFENVFAQPIGTAMLIPGLGREHLAKMKKYRSLASMEVCIQDENVGRLRWSGPQDQRGKLVLDKPLTAQDCRRRDEGLALVASLFQSVGCSEVIRCQQGFGLHLMGGCALGTDDRVSVVSPDFSLHGHPRIFAADSSIFPSAPGINPSLTIMAMTEWAADRILRSS